LTGSSFSGRAGRWTNFWWGYARESTEQQHLTAQRNSLPHSVVGDERIYVDRGLTGTNRDRPGLRLASAACHSGDTLVVTKLDRLARSLPDPRDILDELTRRKRRAHFGRVRVRPDRSGWQAAVQRVGHGRRVWGGPDPHAYPGGLKVAKAKGRLRGKQPKLTVNQARHLLKLSDAGTYSTAELAELFSVGRSKISPFSLLR
jgi:hypothetical protein